MAHSVPIDTREITVTPIFKHVTVEDVPASEREGHMLEEDRKSTRLNSSHSH